jgi:hypothetical protein
MADGPTAQAPAPFRTALICHGGDRLNREALARWLASFSELALIVELEEPKQRLWRRVRREVKRVGPLRFPDVLAFRLYYRLTMAARDRAWKERMLAALLDRYPPLPASTRIIRASSPNTDEVRRALREAAPDLMLARCKSLLKASVFSVPRAGTFVMHPGICPEYRNAHGCFWALSRGDLERVGMTLLRIDRGVDTGPVFGYYHADFDEQSDSHIVIQYKVVFDNLDALAAKLAEIQAGRARPIETAGRESAEWGQPWLSAYWSWRRAARRRSRERESGRADHAPVS